jgi:hypothetical protein
MNTDTTVRIKRVTMNRIRVIAAKRGVQAGVLINQILASRAATQAALDVLDEEDHRQARKEATG